MATAEYPWERALGAVPGGDGTVEFRVWAPHPERVDVRVGGADHALSPEGHGIRSAARPGQGRRRLRLRRSTAASCPTRRAAGSPRACAARRGSSTRGTSRGPTAAGTAPADLRDAVLYELHVGTFTDEGTFEAAIEHLPALAELGVTHIEVMPIAEFPGRHGWGYDGVYLSAAQSSYGGPHGFQRLVDAAHAAGLGVVLDVVYNHLGASGIAAMEAFGPYFTEKYQVFWGKAVNFDDADSDPVREWVLQSAEGWIRDFHVDGLRLDAIHAIFDSGATHILRELADRVHARNHRAVADRRERPQRPEGDPPARAGRLGHGRPVGRRLPPRAARAAHGRRRRLLRRVRPRRAAGQGVPPAVRARRRLLAGAPPPHRRARRRPSASSSSSSSTRTTTRSATARSATASRPRSGRSRRSARCSRPTSRCCSWARSTARTRRSSSSPTTSTRRSPTPPRDGRRREFSAFAVVRGRGRPRPAGPRDVPPLEAHPRGRPGAAPRSTGACSRCAASCRRAPTRTRSTATRPGRGCGCAAARSRSPANFAADAASVPVGEALEVVVATHDGARLHDGQVDLPARAGALVR